MSLTAVDALPRHEPNLYLTLTGPNRAGIVYEVTHELSDSDINILQLSSRVENAAWSGGDLFIAELATRAPESLDIGELRERLDQLENKMTLEIDIEAGAHCDTPAGESFPASQRAQHQRERNGAQHD